MKTQFVFLAVCVIAAFALPERRGSTDNTSEKGQRNNEEMEILNENDGAASDESMDNTENSISSNETTTEKNRSDCLRRRHNGSKRRWLKYGGERRRHNSTELNDKERRFQIMHTTIWQEKQHGPIRPIHDGDNSHVETRHHRHHHHHHHHHKNRTTTTPPPTTTTTEPTPSTNVSEMEE